MRISVDTFTGHGGVEMPQRFSLDGRHVDVTDNLDQWHGAADRYFKVMGSDGNTYILRLDEGQAEWELIMFQSPKSEAAHPDFHAIKRPRGGVRM